MLLKTFIVLNAVLILIVSCQPGAVLEERRKDAEVDSVLFYKQEDISDPFIDAILSDPGDHAQLNVTLYPPEPDTPKFRHIQGFRVQIFAGLDSMSARTIRFNLKSHVEDSVYCIHEKGLYKVQIGDFPFRSPADELKRSLRENEYPGAWVVQRTINVPVKDDSLTKGMEANQDLDSDSLKNAHFTIQLFATDDESKAISMIQELNETFDWSAFYRHDANFYKVFVGRFKNRVQAEAALKHIRRQGYPDAWIVK